MISAQATKKRIVIVGGVAGGANAAVRMRRLSETAEIDIFERGPYVSFANCGLPYHIGGEIEQRNKLLVHTPESLWNRFRIRVHTQSEVVKIDRERKVIGYLHASDGKESEFEYDTLVLATGASPLKPPIEGMNEEGIFLLRDIPDMDRIIAWLSKGEAKRTVVIGGGFIGLEMIEQLHRRGLSLTLIEAGDQVLQPLDKELATLVEGELITRGVEVVLSDAVQAFRKAESSFIEVHTKSGKCFPAELVIFGIGVRPETTLAKNSGISLGKSGGVLVDKFLRTNDPNIYAVGDCIEFANPMSAEVGITPLAGPANRQGRIVANNIIGIPTPYSGALGTAIVRVFDICAGVTGLNEKKLLQLQMPFQAIHLHPNSHASYFPGASRLSMKILFSPAQGRILGAQAVGKDGVDKRIDVLATAIKGRLSIEDLIEIDLCYAPPFSSAKDPVNIAGMMGENIRAHLVQIVHSPDEIPEAFLLDVRDSSEVSRGIISGAKHIPLNELRERLSEVPKDKPIIVYCQSGQRSYYASRILALHGYDVSNLSGAFLTWSSRH